MSVNAMTIELGKYLLDGANQKREGTTDHQLEEAKEGRTVGVHDEVYNSFHHCQGEDEGLTRTINGTVHSMSDAVVCRAGHVSW